MRKEADKGKNISKDEGNFQSLASLYEGMTVFNQLSRHESREMSLRDGSRLVIMHNGEGDWVLDTGPAGSFDVYPDHRLNLPCFTIAADGGATRVIMPRMSAVFGEGDREISVPFSTAGHRMRPDYSIDFTGHLLETRLRLGQMMTEWIAESIKEGRFLEAPVRLVI